MQMFSSWRPEGLDQMPVEAYKSSLPSGFSIINAFNISDVDISQKVEPFLQLRASKQVDRNEHIACEIDFDWEQCEYTCKQIHFQFSATVRHVEIYASGFKSTPWGEQEESNFYIQTLRGCRSSSANPTNLFFFETKLTKNYNFDRLYACKLKCISLTSNEAELQLSNLKLKWEIVPKVQQKAQPAVDNTRLYDSMERLNIANVATMPHLSHEAILKLGLVQNSFTEQIICRFEQSMEIVMERLKLAEERLELLEEQVRKQGATATQVEELRERHAVLARQMADILEGNHT